MTGVLGPLLPVVPLVVGLTGLLLPPSPRGAAVGGTAPGGPRSRSAWPARPARCWSR
ncbi:hypothetical protein JD77_01630 [Micromonospora olivasterospora]|uniref:Uncharacterized protein n=1 Tax=Micromonospora olivasterospora TaxID=1880 RepID=A0A562I6Y4_MICOL|nr:hypothetical protein JD77_01630 [Micromonospora olivasterospora]